MPRPSNINEIVKTINSIGGLMAKVDENGNLVIANERGSQTKPRQQTREDMYPIGQGRPAMSHNDSAFYAANQQAQMLDRLRLLQHEREALQHSQIADPAALDHLEQEELWTVDALYRSGYVPPAATDITSHMLQFGAGEQVGLVKPGGAQDD